MSVIALWTINSAVYGQKKSIYMYIIKKIHSCTEYNTKVQKKTVKQQYVSSKNKMMWYYNKWWTNQNHAWKLYNKWWTNQNNAWKLYKEWNSRHTYLYTQQFNHQL